MFVSIFHVKHINFDVIGTEWLCEKMFKMAYYYSELDLHDGLFNNIVIPLMQDLLWTLTSCCQSPRLVSIPMRWGGTWRVPFWRNSSLEWRILKQKLMTARRYIDCSIVLYCTAENFRWTKISPRNIFCGINFCLCGKGHLRLYVIINFT